MDGKELVILFILLFLAAAAAGIWVSVRRESKRRKPFEELLEESLALPRLDGGSCKAWFQEKTGPIRERTWDSCNMRIKSCWICWAMTVRSR